MPAVGPSELLPAIARVFPPARLLTAAAAWRRSSPTA